MLIFSIVTYKTSLDYEHRREIEPSKNWGSEPELWCLSAYLHFIQIKMRPINLEPRDVRFIAGPNTYDLGEYRLLNSCVN